MKRIGVMAALASAAIAAVLWSVPAAADGFGTDRVAHDKWPGADGYPSRDRSDPGPTTGLPEPGTLALLTLGLGGLGLAALRRKRL
jgi:hypothetical protein